MILSEEVFIACEVLVSFKNADLNKKPTKIQCRRKRNTLRRKRRHFDSFVFWSMNKQQRRVALRKFGNQSAKRKQSTTMSFSTDFALQQLFGAKDAQEIEKRSTVYDFLTQGHLPLIERQQGWIVEIKTRKNGNVDDKIYMHEKSNLRFRSLKQVKAFICNLALPKKNATSIRRKKTSRSNSLKNPQMV